MLTRHIHQAVGQEDGYILFWALMASLMGMFIAVPVVLFAGSAFRGSAHVQDKTEAYYMADATVHGVIEDMKRGADADPVAPHSYTPLLPNFGDLVPEVSVSTVESETLATVKPIDYAPGTEPNLLQGFNPQGGRLELLEDDDTYYAVTDSGDPPKVVWEITSESIEFPTVSFGEITLTLQSSKGSTRVEVFIHNPDDPNHTQNGYNPIADASLVLETANTENTFQVFLEDADVDYLNSLETKQLKIKVVATRSGGFKLSTDKVAFTAAGVVTIDQRKVKDNPVVTTGTLMSGTDQDLDEDDTSYFKVSSSGNEVVYEATSEDFTFSQLDTVDVPLVIRSNKDDVQVEMYVFNSDDPSHTDGGYSPEPDLVTTIPVKNVDKAVTLSVPKEDITFLNSLFPISMKVKVRATHTSEFQLESDLLQFVATSLSAPSQVVQQLTRQYIDPGLKSPDLGTVASHEGYLLRIYNVRPGLLKVNWASHTPDFKTAKTSVQVFRGFVVDRTTGTVLPPGRITSKPPAKDNELLEAASSRPGEGFVQTDYVDTDEGLYTIVFFNDSSDTAITDPFAATGEPQDTWVYVSAFKDYLVDVAVDDVGLKAVVRQVPGPTEPSAFPWSRTNISWMENQVLVQSWEPYGVPSE